jgi:hypothetical protein
MTDPLFLLAQIYIQWRLEHIRGPQMTYHAVETALDESGRVLGSVRQMIDSDIREAFSPRVVDRPTADKTKSSPGRAK